MRRSEASLPAACLALLALPWLAACGGLASSAAGGLARDLTASILDHDDPELIRDGLPSYLLLLDTLARPEDAGPEVLGAAAELYAAYAIVFVNEPERSAVLAARARGYGDRATCRATEATCDLDQLAFEALTARLAALDDSEVAALLPYAVGRLAYIRTHSEDWEALAGLPRVEAVLERLALPESPAPAARVNTYLGILKTLRPLALGGKPEEGRACFERALAASDGKDLSVLVEYARGYARLVYDRELHDELLQRALAADPRQPGLTLFNVLAQRQATELLASANDYF